MTDAIESTADELGTEVAVVEHQPATLFRTDDPVEVIERASKVATALRDVIERQGLVATIQGKKHPLVEAWTTLGSMLGVVPVVEWTRPVERGWEARVEARTLDGRVIGAAEAQCTKDERMWAKRDDYALRSMAQTRATSKALRGPLGFIVTLAGYSATPAEEMPADAPQAAPVERDVQRVERSDVTVNDPWVEGIAERVRPFKKDLRAGLESIGATVPENVGSWGRVLGSLDKRHRELFESWLLAQEEAKANVPWAGDEPNPDGPGQQFDLDEARAEA
jgi:hypothetical protein